MNAFWILFLVTTSAQYEHILRPAPDLERYEIVLPLEPFQTKEGCEAQKQQYESSNIKVTDMYRYQAYWKETGDHFECSESPRKLVNATSRLKPGRKSAWDEQQEALNQAMKARDAAKAPEYIESQIGTIDDDKLVFVPMSKHRSGDSIVAGRLQVKPGYSGSLAPEYAQIFPDRMSCSIMIPFYRSTADYYLIDPDSELFCIEVRQSDLHSVERMLLSQ